MLTWKISPDSSERSSLISMRSMVQPARGGVLRT